MKCIFAPSVKEILIGIIFLFSLASSSRSVAQSTVCKIIYGYDVSGNRIHREYICETEGIYTGPSSGYSLLSSLSPNPTTGILIGTFSEPVPGGEVTVYDMGGAILLAHTISQQSSSFTLDISPYVPATYIVTVRAMSRVESYTVTKL